jgi:hypothetical protein
LFPVLALAGLVGCASGRIWVDHAGPDAVSLHWYTREASIDDARREADRQCRPTGRRAELLQIFADADVTRADFACR